MLNMLNKKCSVCNELKLTSDFYENKKNKTGYNACCKFCDRKRKLKYTLGISVQEFNDLIIKQNNKCCICNKELIHSKNKTHVDHDHLTGKIRGVLCISCNLVIGHAKDSVETLESAIKYLKNNI